MFLNPNWHRWFNPQLIGVIQRIWCKRGVPRNPDHIRTPSHQPVTNILLHIEPILHPLRQPTSIRYREVSSHEIIASNLDPGDRHKGGRRRSVYYGSKLREDLVQGQEFEGFGCSQAAKILLADHETRIGVDSLPVAIVQPVPTHQFWGK